MDIMNVVYAVSSIAGLGVIFGAGLGYASKVFAVEEDPKASLIQAELPGANCGGCGFPGCAGCAIAIAEGRAPVNICPAGGTKAAQKIADIMGVSAEACIPKTAFVKCNGTCDVSKNKYEYFGIDDCVMANQLAGNGQKGCSFGCLGLGSCVKACAFDAISIKNGVAVVDPDSCVACGKCVEACPKNLIELIPQCQEVKVRCNSKDTGKVVMPLCSVGCIACKICEKACGFDAIKVIDNLAVIDYDKCTNCRVCANKCPKNTISGKKPVAFEAVASGKAD